MHDAIQGWLLTKDLMHSVNLVHISNSCRLPCPHRETETSFPDMGSDPSRATRTRGSLQDAEARTKHVATKQKSRSSQSDTGWLMFPMKNAPACVFDKVVRGQVHGRKSEISMWA